MREMSYAKDNDEKQRIFNVALDLMDEIGYEKMTIRKICNDAGISTGKFYHYFSSKQELLSSFYDRAYEKYESECQSTLAGKSLIEQLVGFYRWYGEYVESFGVEFVSNFFSNNNPAMNTNIYNNPVILITDTILIDAIQKGYVLKNSQTVREISTDTCIIVKGAIFDWCVRHGEFSLPEYIDRLLIRALVGIL